MKTTLVLGATNNPNRYAYKAIDRLQAAGHKVYPVGIRKGEVLGQPIINDLVALDGVDTVTLYVGPDHQVQYYDYILEVIKPKRIIFNPGTENTDFIKKATSLNIECEVACTLVLLATDSY